MKNRKLAVDCDGVLVDYPPAYEIVWERAFGQKLSVVDASAYHATNRYGVSFESREQMLHFFSFFTDDVWESLPALPGAVHACERLVEAGFELVTVTALDFKFEKARIANLHRHGFPIDHVITTGRSDLGFTKAAALNLLGPVAMVDDLAANFLGLDSGIHRALIHKKAKDSPAPQYETTKPDSEHLTLAEFANYWLSRAHLATSLIAR
jgi:hypothetical protein